MFTALAELQSDLYEDLSDLKLDKNRFYISFNYLHQIIIDLKTMQPVDDLVIDMNNRDKNIIIFPLRNKKRYLGYMVLVGKINKKETKILYILLKNWTRLVAKTIMEKSLKACTIGVMQSAIYAIEAKDIYTRGHSTRVAHYSELIAKSLNLKDQEIRQIINAALLHDIGKMGIRSGILNKNGPLDIDERQEIFKHPAIGARILQPIPIMENALQAVLSHHEHYDGNGYPNGLKGKEIPLWARIIAIADAFDAMTSDRSYRSAMSLPKALDEIKNKAGIQFDPKIVKAFLELNLHTIKETMLHAYEFKVS